MVRELCEDEKSSRVEMGSSSNGFCYSDVPSSGNNPTIPIQTHLVNHIQGFVTDPEMFNLTTGMEMIGFSKHNNLQQQSTDSNNAVMWKSFLGNKPGQHEGPSSSSSKTMNESCSPNFYHHHHQHEYINKQDFTSGVSEISAPWQENRTMLVDDSSLRCVFPCEGQERPSQGLSLSLSSTNPSTIGLQSFELRHTSPTGHNHQHQQQVLLQQDNGYYSMNSTKAANVYQGHFLLKNSKFLVPAQDLLKEICSLGTRQSDVVVAVPKQKSQKNNKQWEEDNNAVGGCSSSVIIKHSLSSIELVELQKRKTKLLSMLEEVDRRYRHYCNQMKAVVSSFEAVAGNGAATVYSVLALKAMSRHFRCLKDGILDQIQATRKAMGEKDTVAAPGTTRGETPRLRVLDQALRQQRAFQQINMMETHPWRPQRGLPERAVSVLRAWLFEHFLHPYPSDVDKHILARQAGLSRSQVSNWFINARVRLWKPMVEEMYLEEEKEKERQKNTASSEGGTNNHEEEYDVSRNNVENPSPTRLEDQKPTHAIDADCVSSIINNNNNNNNPDLTNDTRSNLNPQLEQCGSGRATTDTFGSVDLDFSSYTCAHQGFHGGGGSGVSLTLGLQQHGGSGVSLAFPSAPTQNPVFYTTRDQMEECQPVVQYSLLDGEGGQNMQYRNLMGTPLLHDLA